MIGTICSFKNITTKQTSHTVMQFYARSYTKAEGEKYAHVTALTVVLTVAQKDAQGKAVPLCTQKAIVPLPGAPVYIEEPGSWDGSNPAVS